MQQQEQVISRGDYKQPRNWITNVRLDFNFDKESTRVKSQLTIVPNENSELGNADLLLNGDSNMLTLVSISITSGEQEVLLEDGTDYKVFPQNDTLVVSSSSLISPTCKLNIVVDLEPQNNKELSGLYFRDNMYCTHCEPSGFRQITYFADRPDNCAIFDQVRIEADQETFPILLSNGNCQDSGTVPGNPSRHYAIFQDPFPKPSYLFGLVVAGNLGSIRDSYSTASGKTVDLVIYGESDQIPQLTFALDTLKNAMMWDEDTYGLEYDLDRYTIVAAQHFSIGAMENKGLNLFMTSLIATDSSCTTDVTYDLVEKTIAHEYFHNWSGNRVTIRDWFEFTLKEGLTVYRDQEFTSDLGLKTATRIEAVKILREKQFAEDASPGRKPIRPDSYYASEQHSLDCLATSTTYHKGAEVCRMLKTILSKNGFCKGLNLYIARHDGTGATCDDFLLAMADANPDVDLTQFSLWYSTAGTPVVSYDYHYEGNRLELRLSQKLSSSSRKDEVGPLLHIPIAVGLLDKETGKEVDRTTILNLKERTQTFHFDDLPGDVVPSLLRDFSAPVYLVPTKDEGAQEEQERLAFLAAYDTDGFNRWEAIQELFAVYILSLLEQENDSMLETHVLTSFDRTLTDPNMDPSSKSYMLNLPTESILSRRLDAAYDPVALLDARLVAMQTIAKVHQQSLQELYDELTPTVLETPFHEITASRSRAIRSLRNRCLEYLCRLAMISTSEEEEEQQQVAATLAKTHFEHAICFTDQLVAFRQISSMTGAATPLRDQVTLQFYQMAKSTSSSIMSNSTQNTILNKWFQTQALSDLSDALPRVQALTQHIDFQANNAGRFRSLITSFTMNTRSFHTQAGYQFIGSIVRQMDRRSPILAVELARKLTLGHCYDEKRSHWMQAELAQIQSMEPISKPLLLTVSKALSSHDDSETLGGATPAGAAAAGGAGDKSKKQNKKKKKKKPVRGKKGFS